MRTALIALPCEMKVDPFKLRIAACFGFLAVALGAMGAHGLKASWEAALAVDEAAKRLDVWKTASLYHVVHAVVLLILAFAFSDPKQGRWTWNCFVSGVIIFSGSLYLLCLTGIKWLGAITPIGGLLLMAGWLLLALGASKKEV
jgi:uncharacterized membrane protein YgdD (TMEM256/DUF423 family)